MILYEKKDNSLDDPNAPLGDVSDSEIRKQIKRGKAAEFKRKMEVERLKLRKRTEKRKKEYADWVIAQSKKREQKANISNTTTPKQLITDKDTDITATSKTLENAANALREPVGNLAKAAIKKGIVKPFLSRTETGRSIKGAIKSPEEREKIQKKRNRREKKIVKAGRGDLLSKVRTKMENTPITQRPGFKKFVKAIKTDVKSGIGKVKKSNPFSSAGVPAPQRTGIQKIGRRLTNPSRIGAVQRERQRRSDDNLYGRVGVKFGGSQASAPSENPVRRSIPQKITRFFRSNTPRRIRQAQRERLHSRLYRNMSNYGNNISEFYGTYDFSSYLEEQYSFWKEEFLVELGSLREVVKEKKRVIDVLKGKRKRNKITMHPTVTEGYKYLPEEINGASIFAKATPPLKKRTTPLSDIVLVKQPGKGTAEKVRDKMVRLFLGDRRNYYANYDFSGHKADDNDMNSEGR